MITAKEILVAVMEQIFNCVPGVEIYKGRLEEGFSVPAFLLNLTFAGGAKANYFTERRNIEIQIIYFGTEDGYGREDFEERLVRLCLVCLSPIHSSRQPHAVSLTTQTSTP